MKTFCLRILIVIIVIIFTDDVLFCNDQNTNMGFETEEFIKIELTEENENSEFDDYIVHFTPSLHILFSFDKYQFFPSPISIFQYASGERSPPGILNYFFNL